MKEFASDAMEFQRCDKSGFLKFENGHGEVADFYALRHTFVTRLASGGVHPKIAQGLARHSTITLTMDRYPHIELLDLNTDLASLPNLPDMPIPSKAAMLTTGTDDRAARIDGEWLHQLLHSDQCNQTTINHTLLSPSQAKPEKQKPLISS